MKSPLITMSALVGKPSDEARQVKAFEGLLNTQRDRFVCSFFVALFPQKHGIFMEFWVCQCPSGSP